MLPKKEEQFTRVSFYIIAHADDWQIFMQPNIYNDLIASDCKIVIIITTAGDAGFDNIFWSAREEGTKSSIRFAVAPHKEIIELSGKREINQHTISFCSLNNSTTYFLRLPDGNIDGNGFPSKNNHSLTKFMEGIISSMTAVDESTTYASWQDFCETLESIIQYESLHIKDYCLHYLNPDDTANSNDHADHIATGKAIQNMTIISNFPQHLFVGYNVNNVSEVLQGADLFWKVGMFSAYEKTVFDLTGYSTLHESVSTYLNWCLSKAFFITDNY